MKIDPDKYLPHEIWQMVMLGKPIKRYPNGYFNGTYKDERFREIFQYICLHVYNWQVDEIPSHLNGQFLKKNKLDSLYCRVFDCNMFKMLDTAFPGIFYPWQLPFVPKGYWTLSTAKLATKWLIEKKLHWSKEDIKTKISKETFIENGVGCLYLEEINGSVYKALCNAYGENYIMPWELQCTPMSYWNEDTIKKPLQWLIDEKGYSKETIVNLSENDIINFGFFTAYDMCNQSLYKLLDITFPGEYQKVGNVIYYMPTLSRSSREKNHIMTGIYYNSDRQKWVASAHNNKYIYLGYFDTKEEAIQARLDYEKSQL